MGRLAPLSEEPINAEDDNTNSSKKGRGQTWRNWIKTHFSLVFNKKSDLKILLSVLGCPLFPVPVHPKQPFNEVNPFSHSFSLFLLTSQRGKALDMTVLTVNAICYFWCIFFYILSRVFFFFLITKYPMLLSMLLFH